MKTTEPSAGHMSHGTHLGGSPLGPAADAPDTPSHFGGAILCCSRGPGTGPCRAFILLMLHSFSDAGCEQVAIGRPSFRLVTDSGWPPLPLPPPVPLVYAGVPG